MLLLSLPVVLIWFFILNFSGGLKLSYLDGSSRPVSDYLIIFLPVLIFISFLGFGVYRSLVRVKKIYDSYELSISDNLIAREQVNTPTISIYLSEVQEIIRHRNGSYVVKGTKANDLIIIPNQIENRDELEVVLDQIKPIATKGKVTTQLRLLALLNMAAWLLMLCVLYVDNKIVVAIAGTLCLALSIYNFIRIQKSKNVDYRTKRTKWLSLLYLLIVIYYMITKLTGSPLF